MKAPKLSRFDANLIVALHALLTERSVTRAAARLGVSQPAMSHSLARLREQFDDRLLVAKGRELVLSRAASKLVRPVAAAVAAFGNVIDADRTANPRAGRTFVVAAADLFATCEVPPILQALEEEVANVELEVRPLVSRSTEEIVSDGVDLAFGVFEDVPATLNQEQLFRDPFVCVVRENHPVVRRALSLERYVALPHIEVSPAPRARPGERIDRWLAARGHQRRVTARVPFFPLAARILARSDHVLTMTNFFACELAKGQPLRVVRCPVELAPLSFSMIWHRRHDEDAAHTWLRTVALRVCRERRIRRP